jgi:hypothetical protein
MNACIAPTRETIPDICPSPSSFLKRKKKKIKIEK